MAKMRVTFRNDFHNTETTCVAEVVPGGLRLSRRQVNRAAKALCGMSDCMCSKFRGPITDAQGNIYEWDIQRTFRQNQQALRFSPPEPYFDYLIQR